MLLSEMKVVTPGTLAEALALLAKHGDQARPLAGGTDAMVRVKEALSGEGSMKGAWRAPVWVHLRRVPELNRVDLSDGQVLIGAAVPYGRMLRHEGLRRAAPLLLEAVRQIGAVQIQAMGTLGGNLGTASPAGDGVAVLGALEAAVQLLSATGGERWVPVEQFVLGPGRTVRQPDELIGAVRFAAQAPGELSLWQKLGLRGAQAIAVVSLAMRLRLWDDGPGAGSGPGGGGVSMARLAYGAVGPTVLRARKCEQMLEQVRPLDAAAIRGISQMAWKEVLPISDVRASAEYRQQMACALLQRGLTRLLRPGGEVPA
jgi:CO/xanthine dehydrogenase FAD-binding subunit